MRILQRTMLFSVLALLIVIPRNIFSCGPFFEEAAFSFDSHPDFPVGDFIAGKLGVLKSSYYRMFLVVAYRNLENRPFTPSERAALEPVLDLEAHNAESIASYGMSYTPDDNSTPPASPSRTWLAERAKANGDPVPQDQTVDPNKPSGEFDTFLNCPDPAFVNAVQTLKDRQQRWGANSADLKVWIAGQDIVFTNCSNNGGAAVPDAVVSNNKLLKQDREYQIAAALFYSGNSDQLHQSQVHFETIANDKSSPWHVWAPYLAARALVRQATLKPKDPARFDPTLMNAAESALLKVKGYKEYAPSFAACDKLLGFVEARLHPAQRLKDVARQLANGTSSDTAQDLLDFRYLMDNDADKDEKSEPHNDDLVDWVRTFQLADKGKEHAIAKWRETKSLPWLVAALDAVSAKDNAAKDLLAAAAALSPQDPRLNTVLYDRIVLLRALGNEKDARALIDSNLPYLAKNAAISSRNLFWVQRLALSQTFDDFLHFAPREDAAQHHLQAAIDQSKPAPPGTPNDFYFDTDGTAVLNRALPLTLLEKTASSSQIPKPLQDEVASASFTRALLLNKPEVAAAFASEVRKSSSALGPYIDEYAKAGTDDARHRAALWAVLHNPGMKPFVVPNMQRTTEINKIDDFRDNWWCDDVGAKLDKLTWKVVMGDEPEQKIVPPPNPQFLSPAEKSAGAAEWTALSKLGSAPDYLAAEVIAWANAAPDDLRVPEALHLVVRSTRYGCTDDKSKSLSKQAYQLLHTKYPKSEWTKKTPYFY